MKKPQKCLLDITKGSQSDHVSKVYLYIRTIYTPMIVATNREAWITLDVLKIKDMVTICRGPDIICTVRSGGINIHKKEVRLHQQNVLNFSHSTEGGFQLFSLYAMFNSKIAGFLALLCSSVLCKEIPVDEQRSAELYRSGKVHDGIMATKMVIT